MRFKIDENLPVDIAEMLRSAGHDSSTVMDEGLKGVNDPGVVDACLQDERVLVTLDLDFADVRVYPPRQFPGFMVLRLRQQDKVHLITTFRQVIPLIEREPVEHRLWIIEESRVRIRGEETR